MSEEGEIAASIITDRVRVYMYTGNMVINMVLSVFGKSGHFKDIYSTQIHAMIQHSVYCHDTIQCIFYHCMTMHIFIT